MTFSSNTNNYPPSGDPQVTEREYLANEPEHEQPDKMFSWLTDMNILTAIAEAYLVLL
jgi:hypothetical protein